MFTYNKATERNRSLVLLVWYDQWKDVLMCQTIFQHVTNEMTQFHFK